MQGILPSSSRSALCVAADFGQRDIIEYLIESGADVNVSMTLILICLKLLL